MPVFREAHEVQEAGHVVVAASIVAGDPLRLIDVGEVLGLEAHEALGEVPGALDHDPRQGHGVALEELVPPQEHVIERVLETHLRRQLRQ